MKYAVSSYISTLTLESLDQFLMKSVIVFGKGSLALRICRFFLESSDFELLGIVPSGESQIPYFSLIDFANQHDVPLIELEDLHRYDKSNVDLGFSCFFDLILGAKHIEKFKLVLNIHNSLLPSYRGTLPINWALENGETVHGVTIHQIIDGGIDSGPIYNQIEFPVLTDDEVIDVYRRCVKYGWTIFQETISNIESIEAIPQDDSKSSTYFSASTPLLKERRWFVRDGMDEPEEMLPL